MKTEITYHAPWSSLEEWLTVELGQGLAQDERLVMSESKEVLPQDPQAKNDGSVLEGQEPTERAKAGTI